MAVGQAEGRASCLESRTYQRCRPRGWGARRVLARKPGECLLSATVLINEFAGGTVPQRFAATSAARGVRTGGRSVSPKPDGRATWQMEW
jgi:hypothetical protein